MAKNNIRLDILTTAQRHFYEKGYEGTIFSDIASDLGITKGLITYYFKTKCNLANEVMIQYVGHINQSTHDYFAKHSGFSASVDEIISMVVTFVNVFSYEKDPKTLRFYCEFMYKNLQYAIENTPVKLYERLAQSFKKEIVGDTAKLRSYMLKARSATAALELAYWHTKTLELTREEYIASIIFIKYQLLDVSPENCRALYDEAYEIYKRMKITVIPEFRLKIE